MSASVLLLVLAGLAGGSGLFVDWAAFRGRADSCRVEFFYAVPYDRLDYQARDTGLVADFSIRFEMSNEKGYRQDEMIFKQARIGSFAEAAQSRRSFVDGFSVSARPGRYRVRATLAKPAPIQADSAGSKVEYLAAESYEGTIEVPDLGPGFALSSIQLAAGMVYDSSTGGFSVVPNPIRRYGGSGLDRVYFYFEGYDLAPAADSYDIRVAVVGPAPAAETLVTAGPMAKPKTGTRVSSALGVSVEGLEAGEYRLVVELHDRGRGESRRCGADFRVGDESVGPGPKTPYRIELTELEKRYYRQLGHVATQREFAYYNALSDSGKEAYLAWFWARHNLAEFARRMEAAANRYRTSRTSGVDTDRGRIYVKYGEPDDVERKVLEIDRKPREYWHYYNLGYVFVFIDLAGDGNFKLVYTTSLDEPRTGYEHYLTPDEEELFR